MKIIYSAPNRAHHYIYAKGLFQKGVLYKFISGFPRLSKRSPISEPGFPMVKADLLQSLYVLSLRLPVGYRFQRQLAYWAKLEQDLVLSRYVPGSNLILFYNGCGLRSLQRARKLGVVSVVEVVNSHIAYQEELLQEEYKRLGLTWQGSPQREVKRRIAEYDLADYILVPSEFVRQSFLEKGFPESKLLKVPYGFSLPEVRPVKRGSDSVIEVLYVGSISVRKGLRYLIQALSLLQDLPIRLKLVGPQAEVSGIADLQLPDNVQFTGVLKGKALEQAYRGADVFCLPTLEDGFGLVLGEAQSYGLPVITTTNSGGMDLLTDGEEGFIVPIQSAEAIAEKLRILATDTTLREAMSRKAFERASALDGWAESLSRLTAVFKACLQLKSQDE
ncbi:MAG: hypothetical protein COA80_02550 [Leeuwenhoekiella sp.]|nr:MAG: hypothetical protein COA80_02550 [Leeuwenhoekiella sp.]